MKVHEMMSPEPHTRRVEDDLARVVQLLWESCRNRKVGATASEGA